MASISKTTQNYIASRPAIKECVARRIINFSALAKQIAKDEKLDVKYLNAILVAANRFSHRLKTSKQDEQIRKLLKKSKVHVKTKVCRFVFAPHAHVEDDIAATHIVKGMSTTTIIVDEEHYASIAKRYEHYIIDKRKGLVEIAIISPPDADKVVGLTAHLASLLASRGINILTTLGTYTDDIFVISQKDLASALSVFDKI